MNRSVVRVDGRRKAAIEAVRERLVLAMLMAVFAFGVLLTRLVDLSVFEGEARDDHLTLAPTPASPPRADIIDRNGVILATSVASVSLAARPNRVFDAHGAARQVAAILPELSAAHVEDRLRSSSAYIRIFRHLSPRQHYLLNAIGDTGLEFEAESKRVYPNGRLGAHAIGFVDADGRGQLGVEKFRDANLKAQAAGAPLTLSLDVRVQHALEDELARAADKHRALGAAGIVMDIHTGELLALASLPDFDPNAVAKSPAGNQFNRATLGLYELGSVFKLFTVAGALDAGTATFSSRYDATKPIAIAGYRIHDDHAEARWLNTPELMIHSSNIAAARMAVEMGSDRQRAFLGKLGLLESASLEIEELAQPRLPGRWGTVQTMTIAYGHGLSVSLLHLAQATAAILNGGTLVRATLVHEDTPSVPARRAVSAATSQAMRQLLRLVVTDGTGRSADVPGYRLGGKTGTAEKIGGGRYRKRANVATFLGAFPMDEPRYVVIAMLDEPQPTKDTHGFTSAAWTAAPVVRNVVLRTAPFLGVEPGPWDVDLRPARLLIEAGLKR